MRVAALTNVTPLRLPALQEDLHLHNTGSHADYSAFRGHQYLQTLEEKSHVYQIIRASALVEYAKSQPLKFRSSTFWYFQTEVQQPIHSC